MEQKKKIAWVTPDYFLDTDVYVIEQLVELYYINWFIISAGNRKLEYAEKIDQIQRAGCIVNFCIIHKKGMHLGNIIIFRKLMFEIKKSEAQLLYTSLSYPAYYLPIVKSILNSSYVILAIHNVHVPKGGTHYLRNKYYNRFAIYAFQNYLTFSQSQCLELQKIARKKNVRYIPFLLKNFGQIKNELKKNYISFLSFGNIREYKRIDVLIEAAQEVYEETEHYFKVIIAGSCNDWNRYQSMIRIPELFDLKIRHISNDEISFLFASSDYFVTPYQDIAQSGSAIIAINYGKPIIASKLPAFEEYIREGETGYFIRPADKNDLKKVMKKVLVNHKENYLKMVKEIEIFREKYFLSESIVKKYEEFIDDVIRKQETS